MFNTMRYDGHDGRAHRRNVDWLPRSGDHFLLIDGDLWQTKFVRIRRLGQASIYR